MSRPRKKPGPVAVAIPTRILNVEDLRLREAEVKRLWEETKPFVACPTPGQIEGLAWSTSSYVAQPFDAVKDKQDERVCSAMRTLLAWCRQDPHDNGLPHVEVQDRRLAVLERAILASQQLAETTSRAWVNPAWDLWFRLRFILESRGETARWTPNSHTVAFMSKILVWTGHPAAKPGAVSMELRSKPEYRGRKI